MPLGHDICRTDLIASYIDGDLEPAAQDQVEIHLRECTSCTEELQLQRLFVCELDSAFAQSSELPVPHDFARIIAANAESDMRGARSNQEHRLALRFCLLLALAAFALLGMASSRAVLASGQLIITKIVGLASLLGRALYDAGVGVAVVLRMAAGTIFSDAFSVLVLLVLLLAALLLFLLISSYHRYHRRGLYE